MGGPNLSMEGALFKVVPGPLTSVIKHKILGTWHIREPCKTAEQIVIAVWVANTCGPNTVVTLTPPGKYDDSTFAWRRRCGMSLPILYIFQSSANFHGDSTVVD